MIKVNLSEVLKPAKESTTYYAAIEVPNVFIEQAVLTEEEKDNFTKVAVQNVASAFRELLSEKIKSK